MQILTFARMTPIVVVSRKNYKCIKHKTESASSGDVRFRESALQ